MRLTHPRGGAECRQFEGGNANALVELVASIIMPFGSRETCEVVRHDGVRASHYHGVSRVVCRVATTHPAVTSSRCAAPCRHRACAAGISHCALCAVVSMVVSARCPPRRGASSCGTRSVHREAPSQCHVHCARHHVIVGAAVPGPPQARHAAIDGRCFTSRGSHGSGRGSGTRRGSGRGARQARRGHVGRHHQGSHGAALRAQLLSSGSAIKM